MYYAYSVIPSLKFLQSTYTIIYWWLQSTKLLQEVQAWGWLPWDLGDTPHCCEQVGELGVSKVGCSEQGTLILSQWGKLYFMAYTSESQVSITVM